MSQSVRYRLEFLVYNLAGTTWNWLDYADWNGHHERLLEKSFDRLKYVVESRNLAFRAFYPEVGSIQVDNTDEFWNDIETTAPELGASGTTHKTGFRDQLCRIVQIEGVTESVLVTAAVNNLIIEKDSDRATIEVVGLAQLAMQQKCDGEKLDDVAIVGDWWESDLAQNVNLYQTRTTGPNGGAEREWFHHKRAYQLFKRTRINTVDDAIAVAAGGLGVGLSDIENPTFATSDDRHTATAVSTPEALGYTVMGICWGDPDDKYAYVLAKDSSSPITELWLWKWNYETDEYTDTLWVNGVGGLPNGEYCLAHLGMNYNPNGLTAGAIYIPLWSGAAGAATTPHLVEIDLSDFTRSQAFDMDTWCVTNIGAGCDFRDFGAWSNRRGLVSGGQTSQGTLVVIVDDEFNVPADRNRILELQCWNVGAAGASMWPAIQDSYGTYNNYVGAPLTGVQQGPAYTYLPVVFCAGCCLDADNADPTAAYVDALTTTLVLYAHGTDDIPRSGSPTAYRHIVECQWTSGGGWRALGLFPPCAGFVHVSQLWVAPFGRIVATSAGVIFAAVDSITGKCEVVGKLVAAYGDNGNYTTQLQDMGPGLSSNPTDFANALAYHVPDDRVYVCSVGNTRLRSIDGGAITPASVRDENQNPWVGAGGIGDPITASAHHSVYGHGLDFRYKTGGDWELHGILVSTEEAAVIFSYTQTFYPTLPLIDLGGLNIWELRTMIADVCDAIQSYNVIGVAEFRRRGTAAAITAWPAGTLTFDDNGWNQIANAVSGRPYAPRPTGNSRDAEVTQTHNAAGSTGALISIATGRSTTNRLFRIVFLSTTSYDLEELISGTWTNRLTGVSKNTVQEYQEVRLTPDSFAGVFVAGDTFTFWVYAELWELAQLDERNKVEVEDTASITKWGRQAVELDNRFYSRTRLLDTLTQAIAWTKDAHQWFELEIDAREWVRLFDVRFVDIGGGKVVEAILVGRKQQSNAPTQTLTLVGTGTGPAYSWMARTSVLAPQSNPTGAPYAYAYKVKLPFGLVLRGYRYKLTATGTGADGALFLSVWSHDATNNVPLARYDDSLALALHDGLAAGDQTRTLNNGVATECSLPVGTVWIVVTVDEDAGLGIARPNIEWWRGDAGHAHYVLLPGMAGWIAEPWDSSGDVAAVDVPAIYLT